jgi:hypothetical protein
MDIHNHVLILKPNNYQVYLLGFHTTFNMLKNKHFFIIWKLFCESGNTFHKMTSAMERLLVLVKL